MVVDTGFEHFRYGEGNRFLVLCFERSLCGRNGEPFRQVVNRVLTCHTGLVDNRDRTAHCGRLLIVHHHLQGAFTPDDAVEVRIDGPHDR